MNEERRKGDRRVSPAVAEFALSERGELLARIAELEAANARLNTSRLSALQDCKDRWTERDAAIRELAELKAQPSAGVVLPERKDPEGYSKGSADWHAAHAQNECLDEVEGLNPCRAQSVPDGWRMVKVGAEGVQFGNAWFSHERITGYTADQLNSGNCRVTGRAYMDWLAAAPSAKNEG